MYARIIIRKRRNDFWQVDKLILIAHCINGALFVHTSIQTYDLFMILINVDTVCKYINNFPTSHVRSNVIVFS
jgi:hypothetical protein